MADKITHRQIVCDIATENGWHDHAPKPLDGNRVSQRFTKLQTEIVVEYDKVKRVGRASRKIGDGFHKPLARNQKKLEQVLDWIKGVN